MDNNVKSFMQKKDQYFNEIIARLLSDDELTKLLFYPVVNALDMPSLTDGQKWSLVVSSSDGLTKPKIYPFRLFNEGFVEELKTMISMESTTPPLPNRSTRRDADIYISLFVFTAIDIMQTLHGNRLNMIGARIDKLLNNHRSSNLGMGVMVFDSESSFHFGKNTWTGLEITFKISDWRR